VTGADLLPLARMTLTDPRAAARAVISQGLSRDALWTGLALVAAINTLVLFLLVAMSPAEMPLPDYFPAPLAFFVLLAGTSVLYVHAVYWTGMALGGKGRLADVLALVVWLLALRAAAQFAIVVLTLLLPVLALLVSLVVAVWGFWIMLNFIAEALALTTLGHAIAVLILGALALIVGLGLLMSVIGLSTQGVLSHV
jgi:hypothetical protein